MQFICFYYLLTNLALSIDLDLYFRPSNSIPPHPALPLSTIASIHNLIRINLVAHSTTGYNILQHPLYPYPESIKGKEVNRSSTGLPSLDGQLEGGWEAGEIIEICGPSNSGKTLLVIYTVLLHLLLNPNSRVVFIDTLSTFDPFRFNAIAGLIIADLRRRRISLGSSNEEVAWEIISERALSRLDVTKCITSGRTIDAIVGSLEDSSKEEKMTMVVIDTATNLLSGDLAGVVVNNNQSTSYLENFL